MAAAVVSWHDFFLSVVGAGAALTGLVFVAISLHPREIASSPVLRTRAQGAMFGFTAVLFVGLAMSIPAPGDRLAATAVGAMALLVLVGLFRLQLTQVRHPVRSTAFIRWLLHAIAVALVAGGGIGLAIKPNTGWLAILAAAILVFVSNSIWQCWLLVMRIDVPEVGQPVVGAAAPKL
jgi:hypothetical protein